MGRSRTESPRIIEKPKSDEVRTRMAGENIKTKETRGDRTRRFSTPPRRDRPSSTSGLSPIPVGSRGHSRPAKRPRPDTGEVRPLMDPMPMKRDRGHSRPAQRPSSGSSRIRPGDSRFRPSSRPSSAKEISKAFIAQSSENRPERKDRNIAEQDI